MTNPDTRNSLFPQDQESRQRRIDRIYKPLVMALGGLLAFNVFTGVNNSSQEIDERNHYPEIPGATLVNICGDARVRDEPYVSGAEDKNNILTEIKQEANICTPVFASVVYIRDNDPNNGIWYGVPENEAAATLNTPKLDKNNKQNNDWNNELAAQVNKEK